MILVFDTETNGLPKNWTAQMTQVDNWPRVVQLAWCVYDDLGRPVKSRQCMIKPDGWVIPEDVSSVHGITTEYADMYGVPINDALSVFLSDYNSSDILVAHNIAFDYPVLGAELIRSGLKAGKKIQNHICTMKTTTELCKIPSSRGFKWPKLSELHEKLFGVGFDGAHDAMVDVYACARCFFELVDRKIINIKQ